MQKELSPKEQLFRQRRLLTAASLPLLLLTACGKDPAPTPQKVVNFRSTWVDDRIADFKPEELEKAQRVRQDLANVFTEFVPDFYLNKGVNLEGDGNAFWAIRVRDAYLYKDEYSMETTGEMGEDGQPYTATVTYDKDWQLKQAGLRAGNVPAFITPDELPKPIPDFTWLNIPPESLKEVAHLAYNLPDNLNWRQSTYRGAPYMSSRPERDFARLDATGKTADGRNLRFSIDEQSFSGLHVDVRRAFK